MSKFCIFCGENPVDKNMEHVIPKWLIKYTGDPKRVAILGKKDGKEIIYSWLNFVFPSCEKCNSDFAVIEAKIQNIINRISKEESITHNDMDLLLDWLDKIRIGLWLGRIQLNKIDISPKFFINQRVGSSDRLCLMYKLDDTTKGIGIIGTGTSVFEYSPSCFGLVINDLLFVNYSKEFLLAENLGFPYPDKFYYNSELNGKVEKIIGGKNKLTFPLLVGKIIKPTIKLYQSILKGSHEFRRPVAGVGVSYFKNNCFKFNNNLIKSYIYVSNEFDNTNRFWNSNDKMIFKFNERFNREVLTEACTQVILEHQNHSLLESITRLGDFDNNIKSVMISEFQKSIQFNSAKINEIKNSLNELYRYI